MEVRNLLLVCLCLAGCYDWAAGDGPREGGDDDDTVAVDDDDDSAVAADDDDATADPCSDEPEVELVGVDPDCRVDIVLDDDPQLEVVWQFGVFDVEPGHDQVMMTPIVIPLTDDDLDGAPSSGDERAILFTTYAGSNYSSDGILRALRGDGSGLLWTVSDPAWRMDPAAHLAGGDIDGDGWPEIVGASSGGYLVAFDRLGNPLWSSSTPLVGPGGAPLLVDLDANGSVEIVYSNQIFDSAGNLLGQGAYGTAPTYSTGYYTASLAVDLDLDGLQEVVVGNAAYDITGAALWANGQPEGAPGVGNFDSDPEGEVVVISAGNIRLQDTDGTVLLGPVSIPGSGTGGTPTVADFDGDGMPEVGVANLGFYTLFDTDLTVLWTNPTEDDSSAITGSSAFDFDADGASEVVYADEHDVWVWHGATGALIHQGVGHASGTLVEYPVVAQVLDADGPPQIVVASNDMWWEGWTGITVLADTGRAWVGTRGLWNQHAFMPTHIEDDLSIPASPPSPWTVGQGFRQNEVASVPGVAVPDLAVELHASCPETCQVRLRVVNTGVSASACSLAVLADGVPVASVELTGFEGGTLSQAIDLVLDPADVAGAQLEARIDWEDAIEECDEDNNTLLLGALDCL